MNKLRNIRDGLNIFLKYKGEYISPAHDEIYCGPADDMKMSGEDKAILLSLGWMDGSEGWSIFT